MIVSSNTPQPQTGTSAAPLTSPVVPATTNTPAAPTTALKATLAPGVRDAPPDPFPDVKPTRAAGAEEIALMEARADAVLPSDLENSPLEMFGKDFRRITAASIVLLKRIKSPFIAGGVIEDIEDPFFEVGKMLAVQSGTLKEAQALSRKPDELELKALEILDQITGTNAAEMVKVVLKALQEATETQVQAKNLHEKDTTAETVAGASDSGNK